MAKSAKVSQGKAKVKATKKKKAVRKTGNSKRRADSKSLPKKAKKKTRASEKRLTPKKARPIKKATDVKKLTAANKTSADKKERVNRKSTAEGTGRHWATAMAMNAGSDPCAAIRPQVRAIQKQNPGIDFGSVVARICGNNSSPGFLRCEQCVMAAYEP